MSGSKDIKDYNSDIENLFISFMLTNPELFVRCKGIIHPYHFVEVSNRKAITFIDEHYNEHSSLPTTEQIKAVSGKKFDKIDDLTENHCDWFLKEYETFARHKELENVILSSADLLEQGRYGEVEVKVKDAVAIGLVKDLGTDYFADPVSRLEAIRDKKNMVASGWKAIDEKLYGGLNRGEITIYAGQSGSGKSLFLQNQAVNWAEMGLNVVYITLELSENLCAMRLDAMVTGYGTREVMKNIEDVSMRVGTFSKKHKGSLQLKQLPNGCTANDVRAYIKEYEVQSGLKVDAVLLDYLDLCMPMSARVSPSDLFVKDKYVTEELRNLAVDLDILFVTASQLNRASHDEIDFDHSHISGGLSKINTADNVIGIFVTSSMKESGRYQVQFMKTRSSAGVGSKVDLKFNIRSLRITDLDVDDEPALMSQTATIASKLGEKSVLSEASPPKTPADTGTVLSQGAKLRDMLKRK